MNSSPDQPTPQDDDPQDDWVAVAKILRPHGLRGTFRLKPLTGNDDDLVHVDVEEYSIRLNGKIVKTVHRTDAKLCKDLVHMKFKEVKDRTDAEVFTNGDLVIRESQRWKLEEGEYYTDDLKNLSLVDDETGEVVGVALEVVPGVANNFLLIAKLDDLKKTELLPFIPIFVPKVDIKTKTARVNIPDGLFDPPPPPPEKRMPAPREDQDSFDDQD